MLETKILLLGREVENHESLCEVLHQQGFTVREVASDEDLRKEIAKIHPALILLNLSADTTELSKSVKAASEGAAIPLLKLANPSYINEDSEVDSCIDGLLLAPVAPIELVTNIKSLLRLSKHKPKQKQSAKAERTKESATHKAETRGIDEREQRLNLAVGIAELGTWSFNLLTNELETSPEQAALFGYARRKITRTPDEWRSRIHPEDREWVEKRLRDAIADIHDYDVEYRIVWTDKTIHWVTSKAKVLHDEQNRPVRVIGVTRDITIRKQREQALQSMLECAKHSGSEYFACLAQALAESFQVRYAFLAEVEAQASQAKTIAFWADGKLQENFAYSLAGTPCEQVAGQGITFYPVGVSKHFPDAALFQHFTVEGYLGAPLKNAEGRVIGLMVVMHDKPISNTTHPLSLLQMFAGQAVGTLEREHAEKALQESEERYRALVQTSSQIVWSVNEQGRRQEFIKWWSDLTGMDGEASRNWGWLEALHPEDRERARAAWQRSRETFEELNTEYRVRDSQGNYHYLAVRGVPLWNKNKTFREWVGTIRDITDRKQGELALRKSNAILTAINQSTEDLIFVKDLEGRFLLINPAFARLTGKAESDIIGKTDWQLLNGAEVERIKESDLRVLYTGRTEIVEETLTLMKGARTYLSTKSPYLDEQGAISGLICISTDITNRKRAEREREQLLKSEQAAREEAQAANRAKDEFLAVVSHELRAPLNAMLGWTRILQSKEIDEATRQRALETIERSARMQAQIIEDLLDTARIISGKLKLEVRSVHLLPVINSALEIMRPAAAAKQIEIDVQANVESDLISGDAERLQQVIWNLLSNAIKFNRPGGNVTIMLQRVDPFMQIVVRDTGKGIDADLLPYIFDRFYQADHSSKRRTGGLGLGLALVRQLVEMHGGSIMAESSGTDQGATFTVSLPIRAVRAQTATLQSPFATGGRTEEVAGTLEGLWVLVVDDEADARDLLTVLLQRYGATVTAVASAAAALEVITEGEADRRPDIIISDIGMPEQDGYMFMRQVRSLSPQYGGMTPAIAVTAYGQPGDRLRALTAGFQSHIPKPVEADELKMVIASLTGRAIRSHSS